MATAHSNGQAPITGEMLATQWRISSMSMTELVARVGLSETTLRKIFRGKRACGQARARQILAALRTPRGEVDINPAPCARPVEHRRCFLAKLRYAMVFREMNQAELSRQAGVSTATVSSWFSGYHYPTLANALALANALLLDLRYFADDAIAPEDLERYRTEAHVSKIRAAAPDLPKPTVASVTETLRGPQWIGVGQVLKCLSPEEAMRRLVQPVSPGAGGRCLEARD